MVNDASRRSHDVDVKDELGGKPEWVGVYCERALKLHPSWKGLSGKAKVKTGIGKSDLPGLQGARGNVTLSVITWCARLGSIPTPGTRFAPPGSNRSGGGGNEAVGGSGVEGHLGDLASM
jgi:hypothetical protein